MITQHLHNNENDINTAGRILSGGGLVAIPTETVYGLAADALNGAAVADIFAAKGRPMDNPLIVHIAAFEDINRFSLVREIPDAAYTLAKAFWPGPLTIIMKKGKAIPDEVSAGLDTVAIRFPSHPVAQAVIRAAETPLAAPSANLSGSPSPTTAEHVMNDMDGRIDAVLDGGECAVGLESTVITLAADVPRVLRPGGVTVNGGTFTVSKDQKYTGTTSDRPAWLRLLQKVRKGDTIVFDSVSRMSRDAAEGAAQYEKLYNKGVNLVFLNEPQCSTDVFRKAAAESIPTTGNEIADIYIEATNKVLMILAKRQIQIAFEQAQKERDDLSKRTRDGIRAKRIERAEAGQPEPFGRLPQKLCPDRSHGGDAQSDHSADFRQDSRKGAVRQADPIPSGADLEDQG